MCESRTVILCQVVIIEINKQTNIFLFGLLENRKRYEKTFLFHFGKFLPFAVWTKEISKLWTLTRSHYIKCCFFSCITHFCILFACSTMKMRKMENLANLMKSFHGKPYLILMEQADLWLIKMRNTEKICVIKVVAGKFNQYTHIPCTCETNEGSFSNVKFRIFLAFKTR